MNLLRGAIDTHVNSFPGVVARKLDDIALVEQARAVAGAMPVVALAGLWFATRTT